MKDIIKRIVARLSKTTAQNTERSTEQTPQRVFVLNVDEAAAMALRHIQMQTIFPHPPVLAGGDTYSDWYARVADVWQRRRQGELQDAPADELQRVINSVMRMRVKTAQAAATSLH